MTQSNRLCATMRWSCHIVTAGLVPAIHDLSYRTKNVDARDIGERKRRRPSDGYARA